jgi:hypothetical protein
MQFSAIPAKCGKEEKNPATSVQTPGKARKWKPILNRAQF